MSHPLPVPTTNLQVEFYLKNKFECRCFISVFSDFESVARLMFQMIPQNVQYLSIFQTQPSSYSCPAMKELKKNTILQFACLD